MGRSLDGNSLLYYDEDLSTKFGIYDPAETNESFSLSSHRPHFTPLHGSSSERLGYSSELDSELPFSGLSVNDKFNDQATLQSGTSLSISNTNRRGRRERRRLKVGEIGGTEGKDTHPTDHDDFSVNGNESLWSERSTRTRKSIRRRRKKHLQALLHHQGNTEYNIGASNEGNSVVTNDTFQTLSGLSIPETIASVPAFTTEIQKARNFEKKVHQKLLYDEE